jgi:tripartite-type tricarboxylate transporter receptor subunit TctC
MKRRRALSSMLSLAAIPWLCPAALWAADVYPTRPIKIIVPYGAGATSDVRARQISERLARALRQAIIIENRSGAGAQ